MQKHAVLITVLFALIVSLLSVSVIFWEFYKLNKEQYINHIFTKYSVITQIYRDHQQKRNSEIMLDANLAVYKLQAVREKELQDDIIDRGKILKREGFESVNSKLMLNADGLYRKNIVTKLRATMLQYKKTIYFYMQTNSAAILIKDEELKPYSYINLLYAYSTLFMIISLSFVLVLQKLRPLIRLRKKIAMFGDGNLDISFKTKAWF